MSKATFVSEIPDKIEGNEVPTLKLVKSMLTSENISNKVNEFYSETTSDTYGWIGPEDTWFTVQGALLKLTGTDLSFHIESEGEEDDVNSSNPRTSVGNANVGLISGEFQILAISPKSTFTITLSNIQQNGSTKDGEEVWEYKLIEKGHTKTDLEEVGENLISLNGVNHFVQETSALKEHTHSSQEIKDKVYEYTPEEFVMELGDFYIQDGESVKVNSGKFNSDTWYLVFAFEIIFNNGTYVNDSIQITYNSSPKSTITGLTIKYNENSIPTFSFSSDVKRVRCSAEGSYSGQKGRSFIFTRGPTDMNSKEQLMTANAVRMYVEAILKEKELIS